MTYFGFLLRFLVVPILVLAGLEVWASRKGWRREGAVAKWPIWLMVVIAVVYTTPWDNYLVATRVWWYDPALVTGIVIGWVTLVVCCCFFFFGCFVFVGVGGCLVCVWCCLLFLGEGVQRWRWGMLATVAMIWVGSGVLLASGWKPGTYLGLELVWALPPVMLHLAFGGDILLRHWKLVLLGIVIPTLYLSAMDSIAIVEGTWTIDPAQSTGIMLSRILPIEEFVFFLLTNVLVTCGLVLVWAPESRERLGTLKHHVSRITHQGFAR